MSSQSFPEQSQNCGEINLSVLLRNMKPVLNPGFFVYSTISPDKLPSVSPSEILGFFREAEGVTLIINQDYADKSGLPHCGLRLSWITLKVHSSLEAVGLTAAFSAALTKANISCNVVAGFYHDHIFVPEEHAQRAVQVLEEFSSLAAAENV